LPERTQSRALLLLALSLILLSVALLRVGAALFSEAAPQGMLSYEFAGDAVSAALILESWSSVAREQAMLSLGLDYLYLIVYPAFFSLACARVATRMRGRLPGVARLGVWLSWAVLAAGPLDALENYALIRLLTTGASDAWAGVAWWCAAPKFALVAAGLAFSLCGVFVSRR
jgi:hypothetical protein